MHSTKSQPHLMNSTRPIESRIAGALREYGEFQGTLSARDLNPILKHVLYVLIAEQKVAGINVPIQHHVSQMQIAIANQEIQIFCEVEVEQPVTAFLRFGYVLENAPGSSPRNLQLKGNRLDVEEVTRRFDFSAKTALKMMNVPKIARDELSNPARVIQRTIPGQLAAQNYHGTVDNIDIHITEHNLLQVHLIAASNENEIAS